MLFITVWTQHGVSFVSVEHDLDDRQTRQSREKMRKFPRRPDFVQMLDAALSQKPRRVAFWRVRRDAGVDFLAEKNTGALSPLSDDAAGAWAPSLSATVPPNGPRFGAFFASRALDPATGL